MQESRVSNENGCTAARTEPTGEMKSLPEFRRVGKILRKEGEALQEKIKKVIAPLLKWYYQNRKSYPWRQDRDPYHVWVSEIMLQQTRIEPVKAYYARFMQALPTLESLSQIDEEQLMKLWEGLGYYSRARNLHKAAQCIMQEYGGQFPQTYQTLRKLPGIGDYTAGAIASICFNEKVPAVDGNVLRVVARILGSDKNVLLAETKKEVTALLQSVMPEEAGAFNEALMELGENICLPNGTPLCEKCPLQEYCIAYEKDLTGQLPVRIKEVKRRQEEKTIFLLVSVNGRIAIEKREKKGLLAGMYQLPNTEGYYTEAALRDKLRSWDIEPLSIVPLGEAKHVFTHIDWMMQGFRIVTPTESDRFLWVTPEELKASYALPSAFKYYYDRY